MVSQESPDDSRFVRIAAWVVESFLLSITIGVICIVCLYMLLGFMFLLVMSFDNPATNAASGREIAAHSGIILSFLITQLGNVPAYIYFYAGIYIAFAAWTLVIFSKLLKKHYFFALNAGLTLCTILALGFIYLRLTH